jgi:hypothetical protein
MNVVAPLFLWWASGGIPTITSTLRALLALPRIATEAEMAIVEVVIFA